MTTLNYARCPNIFRAILCGYLLQVDTPFEILPTLMPFPFRFKILTTLKLILVCAGLISCIRYTFEVSRHDASGDLERYENHLRLVKASLPNNATVGYVSDMKGEAEFYLAEYALTPVILVRTAHRPFVIGNFTNMDAAHQTAEASNLKLMKDFGQGLMLFRNDRE